MPAAALCALAFASTGCSKPNEAPVASQDQKATAPAKAETPKPAEAAGTAAEIGKPAPDFTLTDTDGKPVTLSSLKGKIVVLEWFNADCPFVKRNHTQGSLKASGNEATSKGDVVWLAINSSADGKQGAGLPRNKEARTQYGMSYPVLMDEAGTVGKKYGAKTTPHMFVIDKAGNLAYSGSLDIHPLPQVMAIVRAVIG